MAVLAAEALATAAADSIYNQDKWYLPSLIKKRTDIGSVPFIGPAVVGVARPVETASAIPAQYPWVLDWSPSTCWVFFSDGASAAVTRRISLYEHDKNSSSITFKGFVILKFTHQVGNKTVRAFRMSYEKYTTGTAKTVTGADTVGGVGTSWVTNGMCVGSRIGFGDTRPWQITEWYTITRFNGDTQIVLQEELVLQV